MVPKGSIQKRLTKPFMVPYRSFSFKCVGGFPGFCYDTVSVWCNAHFGGVQFAVVELKNIQGCLEVRLWLT